MKLFAIILIAILVLSSVVGAKAYTIYHGKDKSNSENGFKRYSIDHGLSKRAELARLRKKGEANRMFWIYKNRQEEELERCIRKKTKNWKRTLWHNSTIKKYDKEGNLIKPTESFWEIERSFFGFDKEEDDYHKFMWRKDIRKGKKIC